MQRSWRHASLSALAIVFTAFTCKALALPLDAAHFPADLLFQGKPVNPLCFDIMGRVVTTNEYSLLACDSTQRTPAPSKNDIPAKAGLYGFEWEDQTFHTHGFSYYKAWDAGNHRYWIFTANNGGGSGDFTSLSLYQRENNETILLVPIDGGDRCNGGINAEDIQTTPKGLRYSTHFTPSDFLVIKGGNPHALQAYDDLAACAVCCVANAFYEVDQTLAIRLLYIELGKTRANELPTQGKYEKCFNQVMSSWIARGQQHLEGAEIQQFMKAFNTTCVTHPGAP